VGFLASRSAFISSRQAFILASSLAIISSCMPSFLLGRLHHILNGIQNFQSLFDFHSLRRWFHFHSVGV
jgi:hypothetical protein